MLFVTICTLFIGAAAVKSVHKQTTPGRRWDISVPNTSVVSLKNVRDVVRKQHTQPSQVSVQTSSIFQEQWFHESSGAIIGHNQVLTTARPFYSRTNIILRIVAGIQDLAKLLPPTVQVREVSRIIIYPNFTFSLNDPGFVNNIALLILKEPLVFTENIQPAEIDVSGYFQHENCETSRWDNFRSSALTIENIKIIPDKKCQLLLSEYQINLSHKVCGDVGRFFAEPCNFSEGDLLICGKRRNILVGIRAEFFCFTDLPIVFTRVDAYEDWIKRHKVI